MRKNHANAMARAYGQYIDPHGEGYGLLHILRFPHRFALESWERKTGIKLAPVDRSRHQSAIQEGQYWDLGGVEEQRWYVCPCGTWHLNSRAGREELDKWLPPAMTYRCVYRCEASWLTPSSP